MKCVDSNTVSAPNRRPACGTHIDGEVVFIPESTSTVRRCHCSALLLRPRLVVSRSTVENTQIHLREAVNHLVPLTYTHKKNGFAILEFFFQCAVHHRVCLVWKLTRWVSEWPCWLFLCPSLQALNCYRNLIKFCWWVWLAQWHCWLTCMRLRTTATQSLKYGKSMQSWM